MPQPKQRIVPTIASNSDKSKVVRWVWFIYAAFVVYGSLVPFDFHPLPFDQAWAAFKQTPFLTLGVESRADWIANGVLYVPVGLLGVRAMAGVGIRILPAIASLVIASLLAFVVEFAQLSFPPRTVSQNDLLAECLGSLVGVVAAHGLAPWLMRWWLAWRSDSATITRLAWQGYVLGYILFCFFPFDFLVSRQELGNKLDSGNWGWLFALRDGSFTSWLRMCFLWLVEAALTIPIGLGIGKGQTTNRALSRGIVVGTIIGFAVETGQLFIASGVSQGASLVSRATGVGLGAWLGAGWRQGHVDVVRGWLNRHFGWLILVYLAPLSFAAGWWSHPWLGWDHAMRSWDEVRFLPFYYHYFTTEAAALVSLGSVVVIYAPLAAFAWARLAGAGGAAVLAAMLAMVVESGKLFIADIHPDPTNIFLAGASVWFWIKGITLWRHQAKRVDRIEEAPTVHSRADAIAQPTPLASVSSLKKSSRLPDKPLLIALLVAIAWTGAGWPAHAWLLLAVVAAGAAATWWRPAALIVILPAAMPVFDLAPWSGRFYLDEFDLLCAACLAVGFAREQPQIFRNRISGRALVFLAMMVSLLIGALKAWGGNFAVDVNSFASYHSPFNGLRIFKGALWAWLYVAMYRSLVSRQPAVGRLLHLGFGIGLALTILVVLWERMAMVSLFDFTTDYRVTGPFSVMNKGGAYIECFLAVASAFVIIELATSRDRLLFLVEAIILLLAGYAILVTYSRNGFAALAVALMIGTLTAWRTSRHSVTKMLPALVTISLITVAGGVALSGGYASQRLGTATRDLESRLAHWRAALDLRDDSIATALLGVGLGRFPDKHFWESRTEQRAADYRIEPGDGNAFLRLGPGATIYIEQIISPPAGEALDLSINVRSAGAPPKLGVTLCRKTLLTADECEHVEVQGIKAPGYWQNQYATIPPLPAAANMMAALVPVKISLATPANGQAIDIDNVSLRPTGTDHYLIRNGAFEMGMDHWFFATDIDPPWHIHSLPVTLLFDLGWLGLLAAFALISVAVVGGLRALRYAQVEGIAAFAGLMAFMVSGSLNTLIDEPRFLWLWLVLAWICGWQGARAKSLGAKVIG